MIGREAWFRARGNNVLGLRTENGVEDEKLRGNQLCFFERAQARKQQVRRMSGIFISESNALAGVQANRGATQCALRTVKSFAVLSVRDRSSGNSPATIPHNSRHTNP